MSAPEIQSKNFSATVVHERNFEFIDIGDGVAVYRITSTTKAARAPKPLHCLKEGTVVQEGICWLAEAQKYHAGKATSLDYTMKIPHYKDEYRSQPVLLDAESLDLFLKWGWNFDPQKIDKAAWDKFNKQTNDGQAFQQVLDNGGMNGLKVVLLDNSSHMMFNVAGDSLPVGIYYDYISAQMHNGEYNLGDVLNVLKDDPRIQFLAGERSYGGREKDPKTIQAIPHYNADRRHSSALYFRYMPTEAEAKAIWEEARKNKHYPTTRKHEVIAKLDILGIEKFRISDEVKAKREKEIERFESGRYSDDDDNE